MTQEEENPYRSAIEKLDEIMGLARQVGAALDGALQTSNQLRKLARTGACDTPVEHPVQTPVQPSQHLREHRPGRAKKLATDPELRAFVEARFNRMTFEQIADEVAQKFPPERQVKRSAIHDWFRKVYKRKYQADPG